MRGMSGLERIRLDPRSSDLHGQNAELRARGALVPVELPDGVTAFAVTHHAALRALLGDPRMSADSRHWTALAEGRVKPGWALYDFVTVKSMATADGADHRRLRALVSQAFTPSRVARLRPRVEAITAELLDALGRALDAAGAAGPGGSADFREVFAYRLPITVICELMGFPLDRAADLRRLSSAIGHTAATAEQKLATSRAMFGLLAEVVAQRRTEPADDLISALVGAVTEDGAVLDERELVGVLVAVLLAGHSTVTNLLTNAVRILLTCPDQLALLRAGECGWDALIEETLRWNGPLGHFPMRYATADVEIAGTVIPRGEAVLLSYAAAGRDATYFGPDAAVFDLTAARPAHLSFGYGRALLHGCAARPAGSGGRAPRLVRPVPRAHACRG